MDLNSEKQKSAENRKRLVNDFNKKYPTISKTLNPKDMNNKKNKSDNNNSNNTDKRDMSVIDSKLDRLANAAERIADALENDNKIKKKQLKRTGLITKEDNHGKKEDGS